MGTYFEKERDGPGTHVLIIGAGAYPDTSELALPSAYYSAFHLAEWFEDRFHNPKAPLASIELLASIGAGAGHRFAKGVLIETPTIGNAQAAAALWMNRAGSHPDNIAVFYFAGQSFDQGLGKLLLMDDFGSKGADRGANVAEFLSIPRAMHNCAARRQLYLVDVSTDLMPATLLRGGSPLLGSKSPQLPLPRRAIFYRTSPGRRYFTVPGVIGLFAEAFTGALDESPAVGPISIARLGDAVFARVREKAGLFADEQQFSIERNDDFDFHYPPPRGKAEDRPTELVTVDVATAAPEITRAIVGTAGAGAGPGEAPGKAPAAKRKPRAAGKTRAKSAPVAPVEEANTDFVPDDAEAERDALGRSALAIGLARRLHKIWRRTNEEAAPAAEARAAFVVHLDAPWGGGKTSFANFLARVLNPSPRGAAPARFLREHYPEADLGGIFLDDPPSDAAAAAALAALPDDARRPWIVVPFNAWQAEHCTPPWWVFYQTIRKGCFDAIRRDGDRPWVPAGPEPGRKSPWLRRLDLWLDLWLREFRWRLFNPKVRALLLTAVVSLLLLLALQAGGAIGATETRTGPAMGYILGNGLGLLLAGLTGFTALWGLGALFTESIVPGTNTLAERLSLGSGDPFARFRTHFYRSMALVRRPVMVVVDDLDRCRPDFVVDLVRGIQTLLRSPRVVFLILGDREWIERAFESHHAAMREIDVGPEQSFGARFVEKAIQLSFILPALGEDGRRDYVRRVLIGEPPPRKEGVRVPPAPVTAPAPAPAEAGAVAAGGGGGEGAVPDAAGQAAEALPADRAGAAARVSAALREIVNREAAAPEVNPFDSAPIVRRVLDELADRWFNDDLPGRAENLFDPEVDALWLDLVRDPTPVEQMVGEALAIRATTDDAVEREVTHELQRLAAHFPANPRQIKRIVNAITIYHAVALQRPGVTPDAAFRRQLALWIIIMTEWPRTWRLFASFPDLVDILTAARPDRAIRKRDIRLPGSIAATKGTLDEIRSDPDLLTLIVGEPAKGQASLATGYVRILAELTPLHSRKRRLATSPDESAAPPARAKARGGATAGAKAKQPTPRPPRPAGSR